MLYSQPPTTLQLIDVTSSLLLLDLPLLPVCKEEERRSPSLVQEEPQPPQIKEEHEEPISQEWSEAPSGENCITADVKLLCHTLSQRSSCGVEDVCGSCTDKMTSS